MKVLSDGRRAARDLLRELLAAGIQTLMDLGGSALGLLPLLRLPLLFFLS